MYICVVNIEIMGENNHCESTIQLVKYEMRTKPYIYTYLYNI